MDAPADPDTRDLLLSWTKATFYGWFLGFLLVVVLTLVAGAFGGTLQFMVGLGMGGGVGHMQGRRIGRWIERPRRWLLASALGMGAPFVVWDLAAARGIDLPWALPAAVLAGGLLVGSLQWALLRRVSRRAIWWLPACAAGWFASAIALSLQGANGATDLLRSIALLAGMFGGWIPLAALTGPALIHVTRGAKSDAGSPETPRLPSR